MGMPAKYVYRDMNYEVEARQRALSIFRESESMCHIICINRTMSCRIKKCSVVQ